MIYSTDDGRGLPIVFLHGFCEDHRIWDELKNHLSNHFRVITYDLPGFGKSESLSENTQQLQEIAEQIADRLRSLNIGSAIIVGHSLGGYIALEIAKQHPNLIAGLVLMNSNLFADSQEKKHTRDKVIRFIEKHSVEKFISQFIEGLFFDKKKNLKAFEQVQETASACSEESVVHYTKMMRDRPDSAKWFAKSQIPTLVIAGEYDTVVPETISKKMIKMIPIGQGEILQNCGHLAMYEQPDQCYDLLIQFISRYIDLNK